MRLIAFGDIHMSLGNVAAIPGIAAADLVIITGDLTNFGHRRDAESIINALRKVNSNILALPGNLDQPDVASYLEEQGISLHGVGMVFDNIGIFGVGGSNITPFNTPTEFSEEQLAALLAAGHERVRAAEIRILVSHAPPFGTKTDRIAGGTHVGSRAVRNFIEAEQPHLCLTGHIHEARAEDRISETIILNPGLISTDGWIDITVADGTFTAGLQTEVWK